MKPLFSDSNLTTGKEQTYKTLYAFDAFKKIHEGYQVYVLDRQNRSVALVNDMDVQSVTKIVYVTDKENRYEFWIETAEENKE